MFFCVIGAQDIAEALNSEGHLVCSIGADKVDSVVMAGIINTSPSDVKDVWIVVVGDGGAHAQRAERFAGRAALRNSPVRVTRDPISHGLVLGVLPGASAAATAQSIYEAVGYMDAESVVAALPRAVGDGLTPTVGSINVIPMRRPASPEPSVSPMQQPERPEPVAAAASVPSAQPISDVQQPSEAPEMLRPTSDDREPPTESAPPSADASHVRVAAPGVSEAVEAPPLPQPSLGPYPYPPPPVVPTPLPQDRFAPQPPSQSEPPPSHSHEPEPVTPTPPAAPLPPVVTPPPPPVQPSSGDGRFSPVTPAAPEQALPPGYPFSNEPPPLQTPATTTLPGPPVTPPLQTAESATAPHNPSETPLLADGAPYVQPVPVQPVAPHHPHPPSVPSAPEASHVPLAPQPPAQDAPSTLVEPAHYPTHLPRRQHEPPAAPQEVPPRARAGADGYGGEPDPADNISYGATPWAGRAKPNRGVSGRVVAVCAAKGGVGKSLLSVWLTEAIHTSGLKACLVDGNIAQPDILKRVREWHPKHLGLMRLIKAQGAKFTADDLENALVEIDGLGVVLPGPPSPIEADQMPALLALREAVELLKADYDWIVLDTPVATIWEPAMSELVKPVADLVLVVVTPDETTAHDTKRWVEDAITPTEAGGLGLPKEKLLGVINQADDKSSGVTVENLEHWLGNLPMQAVLQRDERVPGAINQGNWHCARGAREGVGNLVRVICGVHPSGTPAKAAAQVESSRKAAPKKRLSGLRKKRR